MADDPSASAPPPIPDFPFIPITDRAAYLARVHYGVMGLLLTITIVAFSARLYVRVWPVWRVGWDDVLIALGFLSSITNFIMLSFEMFPTPRLLTFATATEAIKLAYLAIPVWVVSMTCIKTSIALTLLKRFQPVSYTTRWWRPLLLLLIVVQLLYFVANIVYNFTKCRPLVAAWDLSTRQATCYTQNTDFIFSLTGSVINIVTDIALSMAPMLAVLWRLRRPRPERILVCCLTGIGLLASGTSIAKAVVVSQWQPDLPPEELDSWAMAVSIATWTVAEQFIAVFGACSPSLKGPIERLLGRFGVSLTSKNRVVDFEQSSGSPPTVGGGGRTPWDEKIGTSSPVIFKTAAQMERSESADEETRTEGERRSSST